MSAEPLLLTQAEVAKLLRVSTKTVRTLRAELRPTYVGRLPRYYPAAIDEYLKRRRERVA